jgi:hypothetical protein
MSRSSFITQFRQIKFYLHIELNTKISGIIDLIMRASALYITGIEINGRPRQVNITAVHNTEICYYKYRTQ